MKKISLFSLIICMLFFLTGCGDNTQNTAEGNTNISKISAIQDDTALNKDTTTVKNATSAKEEELKSFSTKYYASYPERAHNISLTCQKIDGYIVEPKGEFSFLTVVGNMDASAGYKKATIIIGTKEVKGYGGGACQISSTLFNAVDGLSGVEITERHKHGKDVFYVPHDRDATISHSSKFDFKFKNNNSYKLKLEVKAENEEVKIRVLKIT